MSRRYYLILFIASLAITSCKQDQPNWSNTITFSDDGARNIAADGYDTVKLTARIGTDSDPDKRVITFSTDFGTFTNGQNTISLTAGSDGTATTAIKSLAIGKATVRATVNTNFSAVKLISFQPASAAQLFTASPPAGPVSADGVSTAQLSAVVNPNLLYTPQSIVFVTDGGTFGNATTTITQPTDANGNVSVYLKSNVAATYHVTMTNNGLSEVVPVVFSLAAPDYILLSAASTLTGGYGNSLAISISAKRNTGSVSTGYLYNYAAVDTSGNAIGIFSNGTASDASGNATVSFTTGSSTYKGAVTITVSLQTNPAIKASAVVQIQ